MPNLVTLLTCDNQYVEFGHTPTKSFSADLLPQTSPKKGYPVY